MRKTLQIKDGSKIVIIGGGPAGSFFADFALHKAKELGINIQVSIYDRKSFLSSGQQGCNMCAGVISEALYAKLKQANIIVPNARIQQSITGYYFKTKNYGLQLYHPENQHISDIVTVFRGGGPKNQGPHGNISFDDCLLKHAENHGAEVVRASIREVDLPHQDGDPVNLISLKDGVRTNIQADLVVGAFGLNTSIIKRIVGPGVNYAPPKSVRACNAELYLGKEYIEEHFGKNIYCLALGIDPIKFAALTPKGEYITVSLVGRQDITKEHLVNFLKHEVVKELLPVNWKIPKNLCICFPKIPVTHAKKPYADKLVIIGDASISRFYKSGIESAFHTARLAADTAFSHGISSNVFKRHYYNKAKKIIAHDNFYGHVLYSINGFVTGENDLMTPYLQYTHENKDEWAAIRMNEALWGMVTGNILYRDIFLKYSSLRFQFSLLPITVKTIGRLIAHTIKSTIKSEQKRTLNLSKQKGLGPLVEGNTVVIIGGGPAGTSCAISLLSRAKKIGITIKVILYEWKSFDKITHNECAGVLSPPIRRIIEQDLAIPFPDHLIESRVKGYYLHSNDDVIKLEGSADEISYGVLRPKFDKYMLEQAREAGAEIINSRVTDIEIGKNIVTVYSAERHTRAEVVIGAFGLEEGSGQFLERESTYMTPRHLLTILTKFHPDENGFKFLKEKSDFIHAFLPTYTDIEFGAVTPKEDHYTINIAGEKIHSHSIERFLTLENVREVLPPDFPKDTSKLDFHRGCFPISPAKDLIGDRYAVIGDAAGLIRPFKGKGVNSACLMGIKAAEVMMEVGISKSAFNNYFKHFSEIIKDLPYARVVRRMVISAANRGYLSVMIKVAKEDETLQRALFYSVAGTKPYRTIVFESIKLSLLIKLTKGMAEWVVKKYLK